eukprot:Platyproteum_vivax@DN5827_c0_g1_i3.p1
MEGTKLPFLKVSFHYVYILLSLAARLSRNRNSKNPKKPPSCKAPVDTRSLTAVLIKLLNENKTKNKKMTSEETANHEIELKNETEPTTQLVNETAKPIEYGRRAADIVQDIQHPLTDGMLCDV